MDGWVVCLGSALALVAAFVGWVAWMRGSQSRHRARVREAVRAYVEKRGGTFTLDPDGIGFRVKGPLGEGHERGAALDIMCPPGDEARWETSIGFSLRRYLPDAFDEQVAKAAQKRLTELGPKIAALSEDQLRARLRLSIESTRAPTEGLATCAAPLAGGYEMRVVLDGFDLEGLPKAARARLSETDAELRERALAASLPKSPPAREAGAARSQLWLCRPEAIFGTEPHLIVGEREGLAWIPVEPGDVEARLVALCNRSLETGPMKGSLWAWDGTKLSVETIVVHTIMGPTTPDYTLRVPASFHETLGIHPASDGTFGVRRSHS